MTGGQVAALIFAILLLFPGGCFLLAGIGMLNDRQFYDTGVMLALIGIGILSVMGLLFWLAFRKRPPSAGTGSTPS
jgi:hypothetical protein